MTALLIALDDQDLSIVSAHVQDAVMKVSTRIPAFRPSVSC